MAVSLSDSPPPQQGPMCPVCFRDYDGGAPGLIPRILQCGHSYCTECLDRLLNPGEDEDDYEQVVLNVRYGGREWTTTRRYPRVPRPSPFHDNEIRCPTCSSVNRINNRDVTGLTKNFALLSCQSMESNAKLLKHFCKEHEHEKRIYCSDCRDLICAYCQLYGAHKSHSCIIASEAAQPSVEELKSSEISLAANFEELSKGEAEVKLAIEKLKKQKKRGETKVRRYFGRLLDKLVNRRDLLLAKMMRWSEDQMYILQAQHESLAGAVRDSEEVLKKCRGLIEGDSLDVLTQHEDMASNVETVCARISNLSFQPLIKPWIKTTVCSTDEEETITSLINNCDLTYSVDTRGDDNGSEGHISSEDGSDDDDDDDLIEGQAMGGFVTHATLHNSADGDDDQDDHTRHDLQQRLRALQLHSQESRVSSGLLSGWYHTTTPLTDTSGTSTNPRFQTSSASSGLPSSSQAQASDDSNTMFLTPNFSNMLNSSHMLNLNLSAPPDFDLAEDDDDDDSDSENENTQNLSDQYPGVGNYLSVLQQRQQPLFGDLMMNDSDDEEEEGEGDQTRHTGYSTSVLDSLEMRRRHPAFYLPQVSTTLSRSEEEGTPTESHGGFSIRSAHSDPASSHHDNSEEDHDSSSQQGDEEDEIVFPNPPTFSWTVGQGGIAHVLRRTGSATVEVGARDGDITIEDCPSDHDTSEPFEETD